MAARILVIEDNPANLDLMVYLLRAFGYEVRSGQDGEEGLQAARRERPDLILCDIQMPRIDGYEVCRRVRLDPELRSVPVVAVTAYAMVGDRDKVLAAGFKGYIAKPIAPEVFVSQVEAFFKPEQRSGGAPAAAPSPANANAAPMERRGTVFAVDDSAANLSMLRALLESSGYEVVTATTLPGALEALPRIGPDLIVCDLHLAGDSGLELLQAVKGNARLAAVPFLLLSSSCWNEQDRLKGLELGAADFIRRPIEASDLLARIEQLVSAKRPQQPDG